LDPAEDIRPVKSLVRKLERYDIESVTRYMNVNSASVSKRQFEVFFLYWRDNKSVGVVARLLDISAQNVKAVVKNLRKRSIAWHLDRELRLANAELVKIRRNGGGRAGLKSHGQRDRVSRE